MVFITSSKQIEESLIQCEIRLTVLDIQGEWAQVRAELIEEKDGVFLKTLIDKTLLYKGDNITIGKVYTDLTIVAND